MVEKDSRRHSESPTQRKIERSMLEQLNYVHPEWKKIEWHKVANELMLPAAWHPLQPDGVWLHDNGQYIITKCYVRISPLKHEQYRKLTMDALKPLSLRNASANPHSIRCLLVVSEETNSQLETCGWLNTAICQSAEIIAMPLVNRERAMLRKAVIKQGAGIIRNKKVG